MRLVYPRYPICEEVPHKLVGPICVSWSRSMIRWNAHFTKAVGAGKFEYDRVEAAKKSSLFAAGGFASKERIVVGRQGGTTGRGLSEFVLEFLKFRPPPFE